MVQIALLAVLDVTGNLPMTNGNLEIATRLGLSALTLVPIVATAVLAAISNKNN